MYLLLGLTLLGGVIAVPFTPNTELRNQELAAQYVLPGESFPTFYDVRLFLNPDNPDNFTGLVSIRILANYDTNVIVLHAMETDINSINVYRDGNEDEDLFNNYELATDDTHILKINLNRAISPNEPYVIHIDYVARFAENMFGVYLSTYTNDDGTPARLITSQLQPTFARRAFPCYDEPALKAVFRTTIYAPAAYPVVVSNMPLRATNLKEDVAGFVKHEFEDTLLMSTYLLAYLVSTFESVTNAQVSQYRLPFRVYTRPGILNTAEFAMDFGQKNMVALEEYTEFEYAFPKLDNVAVPDFAAGAMENWGLIVYREVALLVTEGVTTTFTKQNIGRIISHENIHQWFGNEVGPSSWTYTWLNEGFANFFESFATNLVLPEWRMMDQFVLLLQSVMQNDAVLSVNPMTHPVYTPSQILGTFNAVAYQKSGSVIRMIHHFLTPEVFRRGLVIYIQANSRAAATPSNLYAAMQQALSESNHSIPYQLDTVMTQWETQGGFPILNVRRTSPESNSVFVDQERYLTDRSQSSSERWHVPLNWVLSTNIDFSDTSPQGWLPPSFTATSFDIPGLSNAEWFIFNKQQTGYYRVNYDPSNWEALTNVLADSHETIHVLNRAQLVDDSFNLARNGRLDYQLAFQLSLYLEDEKDYIPWGSVQPAWNYLDVVLSGSAAYEIFQEYVLKLTAPMYEELGFNALSTEEFVTAYHRNIMLDFNCRYGNQDCLDKASELLQQFRENPSQRLNPDIQTTVYCSGLRGGDEDNFNFLWQLFEASTDSSEQTILLNAMGCTGNEDIRQNYLNQVIDDSSPVREQDKHTIVVSVINSSPQGMEAALDFVIQHWPEIQPRVQGLTGTTSILNAFASRLTTQAHLDKINELVTRHQAILTAGEQASIGAIRENVAASIAWSTDNYARVNSWLRLTFRSSATALTSGVLVFVSVVVAVFNY
ncbi:aminopeptidase N-like [Leguminivora glycinivorella]|uniref:aminopeptidase N-like n=1 Tax=Leguminivora glycinivorella TaxID=1035111 RepID=UPI00200C4CFC|nr:aminopeptidase N-like [Leguminivora glycinivorella]